MLCFANRERVASESLGFRIVTRILRERGDLQLATLSLSDAHLRGPLPDTIASSLIDRAALAPSAPDPSRKGNDFTGAPVDFIPGGARLGAQGRSLAAHDLILLSLSFEGDVPNVPRLLALGGLPPLASARRAGHPLVVAGGAMVMINPEPAAAFVDLFMVGEAEGHLNTLVDQWLEVRFESRDVQLRTLGGLTGALAPALRRHRVWSLTRAGLAGLDDIPLPLLGDDRGELLRADRRVETVHWDGITTQASSGRLPRGKGRGPNLVLELGRGCPRRCRFCAAGRIYAPLRECPADILVERVKQETRPGDVVGLMSLSAGDYRQLEPLVEGLLPLGVRLSMSSLPATFQREDVVRGLIQSGAGSLTIAPETGTDRLRKRIGKPLTHEAILQAVETLGRMGLKRLRAYFILGLPGETEDDVRAILTLLREMNVGLGPGAVLSATVNAFVPKPRTPFQWAAMAPGKLLQERARLLRLDRPRGVQIKIKSFREARYQALLSRGDAMWGPRLLEMARTGQTLAAVLRAEKMSPEDWSGPVAAEAPLPWDYLMGEKERTGLWREWETSRSSQE